MALVPYKPEANLADQRKAKNALLKKRVAAITAAEKLETQSVTTDGSGGDMFVTKTKESKPSKQTAMAIQALAIMNKGKPTVGETAVVPVDENDGQVAVWSLEGLATEEQNKLEQEMKAMFSDIEEIEQLVTGNEDLHQMDDLIKDTSSAVDEQGKAFENLLSKI